MRSKLAFLLTLLALLFAGPPAWAEMVTYTDEEGRVHFTDSIHSVPERYRGRVELKEDPAPAGTDEVIENQAAEGLDFVRDGIYGLIEPPLDQALRRNKLAPLAATEKRSLKNLLGEQSGRVVLAGVLAVLGTIACTIHALLQRQLLWALGGLIGSLILSTLPFVPYAAIHVGNDRGIYKLGTVLLLLAPLALIYEPASLLWQLVSDILTSPLRN